MTGAELLPLLREIDKRKGPVRIFLYQSHGERPHRRAEISVPDWGYVTSALAKRKELALVKQQEWAIVGALMEDASWHGMPLVPVEGGWACETPYRPHRYESAVEAACMAWLNTLREEKEIKDGEA